MPTCLGFEIYGGQNALNQMSDLADQVNNVNSLVGDIAEAGAKGQWTGEEQLHR